MKASAIKSDPDSGATRASLIAKASPESSAKRDHKVIERSITRLDRMRTPRREPENLTRQSAREIFALWSRSESGSGGKLDLKRLKQSVGALPRFGINTG